MKKFLLGIFVFGFAASLAFAQGAAVSSAVTSTAQTLTLKGEIIDNMCASGHKNDLADFVKTHTKQCVLMPGCVETGFSILSEGKLYKFTKDSNDAIAAFLKKDENKLQVTVKVQKVGDELKLVSIENQQ